MSYIVLFRGRPACPCLAAWLPRYERELLRRKVIKYNIDIYQLIGGAASSAGTHSKGGAYDLAQVSDEAILVAREMGAAAWHRPTGWDGPGSISHQHGVLNGCPHNTPARYQIAAYEAGYNGLGHLGEGGRDTGPRVLPLRTWQQGIEWANAKERPTLINRFWRRYHKTHGWRVRVDLLDRAAPHRPAVKKERDLIDALMKTLPHDKDNSLVNQVRSYYAKNRIVRLGMLSKAVNRGRTGTVKYVRDEIVAAVKRLPKR